MSLYSGEDSDKEFIGPMRSWGRCFAGNGLFVLPTAGKLTVICSIAIIGILRTKGEPHTG